MAETSVTHPSSSTGSVRKQAQPQETSTPASRRSLAYRRGSGCSIDMAIRLVRRGSFEIMKNEITFLNKKLGEGGMAMVFQAEWKGTRCAAKMLKHGVQEGTTEHNDLISELSILTSVGKHRNLVTFLGASIEDLKAPIIVQELVEGPDLETFMNSKHAGFNLGRTTVYRWTHDILSALNHLHDRNPIIMHRDLKPSNILITSDLKMLKLADFGLAKEVSQEERMQMAHASNTGTLRYMAPEVFGHTCVHTEEFIVVGGEGAVYTEKADIYSAALIIWSIVTGLRPYIKIAENPEGRPNIALARSRWPGVAQLLTSMWNHVPEERPSAKTCLAYLRSFSCTGFRTCAALTGTMWVSGSWRIRPACLRVVPT